MVPSLLFVLFCLAGFLGVKPVPQINDPPTGLPTTNPTGHPSIVPTAIPTYGASLVIPVDVSLGDLPLVPGGTYDCGGATGITTSTDDVATTTAKRAKTRVGIKPCVFRAAIVACIRQPDWRGASAHAPCTVQFPPAGTALVNGSSLSPSLMTMYPQPIQIPTGPYFDLRIDFNGWTFQPGFVSLFLNQPLVTTQPSWYMWQFMTTKNPRRSSAQEVKITRENFINYTGPHHSSSSGSGGSSGGGSSGRRLSAEDEDDEKDRGYDRGGVSSGEGDQANNVDGVNAGGGAATGSADSVVGDDDFALGTGNSNRSAKATDSHGHRHIDMSATGYRQAQDQLQQQQQQRQPARESLSMDDEVLSSFVGEPGVGTPAWNDNHPYTHSAVNTAASPWSDVSSLRRLRAMTVQSTFPIRNNSLTLFNATFKNFGYVSNQANLGDYIDQFNGAVAYLSDIGTITLSSLAFVSNLGIKGGALNVNRTSNLILQNVSFVNNRAYSAGGIYASNIAKATISGCTFYDNVATKYQGGGAYFRYLDKIVMDTSFFIANTAKNYSVITASKTYAFGGFGGGVAFSDVFSIGITNVSFSNNSALHGGGMVIGATMARTQSGRMQTDLLFNNFFGNVASVAGGGLYWLAGSGMQPPRRLQTCLFDTNRAAYGPDYATEASRIHASPNSFVINDYNNREVLQGSGTVRDYYGHLVVTENNDFVNVISDPNRLSPQCMYNQQTVKISGSTQSTTRAGFFQLRNWGAGGCLPSKTINATYTLDTPLTQIAYPQERDASIYSKKTYQLQAQVGVFFRPCGIGEYYAYTSGDRDACQVCADGYSFVGNKDNVITKCKKCPIKAARCFSNQIILRPGTWRWAPLATTILDCPFGIHACQGGNRTGSGACRVGHYGPVCGICTWQYYPKNYQCLPCSSVNPYDPQTLTILGFLFCSAFGYLVTLVRRYAKKNNVPWWKYFTEIFKITYKRELSEEMETAYDRKEKAKMRGFLVRIKIVIATYQVVLQAPNIFDIKMGPLFQSMVAFLSFLNFDVFQIIPLQCLQPFAYIESMISSTLMPVFTSIFLGILYMVQRIHIMSAEKNRVIRRDKLKKLFGRYFTIFISFTYMILPSTCMKILKTFDCVDIDPNNESPDSSLPHVFLRMDYAVDCTSKRYNFGYLWALGMVGVYVVLLPFSNFLMLFFNRKEIQARMTKLHLMRALDEMCDATPEEMEEFVRAQERKKSKSGTNIANTAFTEGIQFLWSAYKAEYWYWEIIETYRRLSCTSILTTFYITTPLQCVFATFLSIIYVKLYTSFKPYFDPFDNFMAEFGHYQIFFTFFSIYVLRQSTLGANEAAYYLLDTMVVGVNTLVVGSFLMTILQEYLLYLARMRRVRGGLPDDIIPKAFRTVRTKEQDMQLVLTALKRNPKILEQIGQTMDKKKGDRAVEKRSAIVMSASSLEQLLLSKAKRREGVTMSAEQFQELMLANAKTKKDAAATKGLGLDASKLRELQEMEGRDDDSDSDSESGSGSGSGSGSDDSDASSRSKDSDDRRAARKAKKRNGKKGKDANENDYSATDSEEEAGGAPEYSDTDSSEEGDKSGSDSDSNSNSDSDSDKKTKKKGVKISPQAKGAPLIRKGPPLNIRLNSASGSASSDSGSGSSGSSSGSSNRSGTSGSVSGSAAHQSNKVHAFRPPQYSDSGSSSDSNSARKDNSDEVQIRVASSTSASQRAGDKAASLMGRMDRLLGRK